jgi:hypothetical protein
MDIIGDWDVRIRTPIGTLELVYEFREHDGAITGSATGRHETVPLTDIVTTDNGGGRNVTWRQTVTRPMRLELGFDVVVEGDRFRGCSRAARLPRTEVTGVRRT